MRRNFTRVSTSHKFLLQVRAAVFSMIHARVGSVARLPEGSRWLDLFAGTGSIGLEVSSFRIPPARGPYTVGFPAASIRRPGGTHRCVRVSAALWRGPTCGWRAVPDEWRWMMIILRNLLRSGSHLTASHNCRAQALSRGCERATFVELDPWVTQRCLQPNIDACELRGGASVVTTVRPSASSRNPTPYMFSVSMVF